jgi:hypothetical protein
MSSRGYTQPRRHRAASVSSRHSMIRTRFECTASISTDTTGDPGGSGSMTFVTRKCFSLFRGSTAVHFVWSSFFGLNALDAVGVIKILGVAPQ